MLNKIANFLHKRNISKLTAVILVTLFIVLSTLFLIDKNYLTRFYTGSDVPEDYLVYVTREYSSGKGQLMFYAPVENIHTRLLPDWDVERISISEKNRLAFSSSQEDNSEVYILDYPFTDNEPQNITNNAFTEDNVFSWSPDGRYLAIESKQDDEKTLSIWDGENIFPIYEHKGDISELTWSPDNFLTFTEFYFDPVDAQSPSEIFIWDGNTTVSLSQNPSGEDRFPVWNMNGELALLSEHEEEYDIFIWDGVSNINGLPDVNSFVNIAPNLTDYYSRPVWTNSSSLSFGAFGPNDAHAQIYEWDGEKATNISRNPDLHNGGQSWRSDGFWAFVTYFSGQQLLYVRDKENKTTLTTNGQYAPAWSQNGYLLFCNWNRPDGWELLMWDGTKIIDIAQSPIIDAVWRNGEGVYCSDG